MTNEYKPGFKAWLLSIFLAAGLGGLLADGIRYIIIESNKTEAILVLQEKFCSEDQNRIICNFYFENTGDEVAYITGVVVDGKDHPRFFTNNAIEINEEDRDLKIKRAHVAIAEPNKMLMIGISIVKPANAPEEVCFYYGDKKLTCN